MGQRQERELRLLGFSSSDSPAEGASRSAFPLIRAEAQASATRGPRRKDRPEPAAHASVVTFCEALRLQGRHTFVRLPRILAFFFRSNGGVCVKREGRQGKKAAAHPSPRDARVRTVPVQRLGLTCAWGRVTARKGRREGEKREGRE